MSDIFILDTQQSGKEQKKDFVLNWDAVDKWLLSHQSITLQNKITFFRLMATMVNAGLSVVKAVTILEKQEKSEVMKQFYAQLIIGIKTGKNLSGMMRQFPQHFKEAECAIVESGEKTGRLNGALLQLADQVEKTSSITKKFKGAMIYPIAVVSVAFIAVSVMMVVVVPRIVELFGDRDKLPEATQLLIAMSDFMVNYVHYIVFAIFAFVVGIKVWRKTERGNYLFDRFLLQIPIFGKINQKIVLSLFARVLSSLLSSGISIVESLRIVSEVVGNEVYRQRILLLREDVKKGVRIGESLEDDKDFPEMLVQMIKVGEESAKLEPIILKVADFYDEEVDVAINGIQKVLEPAIIVVLALIVGGIAAAIMLPIMNLADVVSAQ